jgi:hypothetical protein
MTDDQIIEIRRTTKTTIYTPFADTLAFARNVLDARELAGWMVVDKNGVKARTIPSKDYAPCSVDVIWDRTPDELLIEYMDREYSGGAPHTLRKIYF